MKRMLAAAFAASVLAVSICPQDSGSLPANRAPWKDVVVLRMYDIRDLVGEKGGDDVSALVSKLVEVVLGADNLRSARCFKGMLAVAAPPDAQDEVQALLKDLRAHHKAIWKVDMQYLRVTPEQLRAAGLAGPPAEGSPAPMLLEPAEAADLLSTARVVTAPSLQVLPLQRSMVSVGNDLTLIKGYGRVDGVLGHPDGYPVPQFEQVFNGTVVRLCLAPVPAAAGGAHLVNLTSEHTRLEGEVRTVETPDGPVHRVDRTTSEVSALAMIPEDRHLLLTGLEERRRDAPPLALLISVERTEDTGEDR